jgi:hypothetical protein
MIFGDENKDERPDAADQDAQTLTLLRIYDVLMAMYKDADLEGATRLEALHQAGGLGAPIPHFDPRNILS